jgi:hypothetical protein
MVFFQHDFSTQNTNHLAYLIEKQKDMTWAPKIATNEQYTGYPNTLKQCSSGGFYDGVASVYSAASEVYIRFIRFELGSTRRTFFTH